MKITIADNSGFCFGVKRAVDKAVKTGKASTLGPLIHNSYVIDKLREQGIEPVNSVDEAKDKLIIRSHGVPDSTIDYAKGKGLEVIDTTCTFVKKVKELAKDSAEKGYRVVIVGERNHPEVIGIAGNIKDVIIIENPDEVKKLPSFEKLAVVSQTTQSKINFEEIVEQLRKKAKELRVTNTICGATAVRQKSAMELAKQADIMVVIGGKESGNTRRLFEICKEIVETKFVETKEDLKKEWFKSKEHVGITAGASTPDSLINEVAERIKNDF